MSPERNKATVRHLFEQSFAGNLAIIDEAFPRRSLAPIPVKVCPTEQRK